MSTGMNSDSKSDQKKGQDSAAPAYMGREIPELDGVGARLLPVGVVIIAGGGVALLVLGVAGLLAHVAVVRTIACTGRVT
jgi:hypothetical protein